jgi:hypothetical protein
MADEHLEDLETSPSVPEAPEVFCKQCKQPIPVSARLCVHCKSYQDWRGYLSVSSTVLALLVALISVLTAAVPVVTKALRSDVSNTIASEPIFDGVDARIVISNLGEDPSVIRQALLRPYDPDPFKRPPLKQIRFKLKDTSAGFIPKGNAQIIFEALPEDLGFSAEQIKSIHEHFNSEEMRLDIEREMEIRRILKENEGKVDITKLSKTFPKLPPPFIFFISIIESDGKEKWVEHPISLDVVDGILSTHAASCRVLREAPSISNGCLSRPESQVDQG